MDNFTPERIEQYTRRRQELYNQYGDRAVQFPEFNQITKILKYVKMQQQQMGQPQMAGPQMGQMRGQPVPPAMMPPQQAANPQQPPPGFAGGARPPSAPSPMFNGATNGAPTPQGFSAPPSAPSASSVPSTMTPTATGPESAFTKQQMQMVKTQLTMLNYLKNPQPTNAPLPQNVVDFVTNERNCYASGPYLPAKNAVGGAPGGAPGAGAGAVGPTGAGGAPHHPNDGSPFPAPPTVDTPKSTPGLDKSGVTSTRPTPTMAERPPPTVEVVDDSLPVVFAPHPPVPLSKVIPDINDTKKTVVPVMNPMDQVDTFELPESNHQPVPFADIDKPDFRVMQPYHGFQSFSMSEIVNNWEVMMAMRQDDYRQQLQSKLESSSTDDKEKSHIEAELAKLELLPLQKTLRGHVLSQIWFSKSALPSSHPNFLAKFSQLSMDNVYQCHEIYRHQMQTLLQVQNRKHQTTITDILAFRTEEVAAAGRRKERMARFVTKVGSFHNQVAKEEQKRVEKMAKQRLQALKSNDEEAYLKLLDHTKDTRITHLLKQTNTFLDSLAAAVQTQQKETSVNLKSRGIAAEEAAPPEEDTEAKREKIDYYHVAHRVKEEVTVQPSILVGGTLKEYQLKGLQWMVSLFNNHLNGILADEMGLGKTIQTISLITYLVEVKKIPGPFLVIVPLSTLTNWNMEFDKWAPSVKKVTYKGTPNQRKILQGEIRSGNFQVLLTTFEYIIKDKGLLSRIKWVHMIIDEGHRMKNAKSKLSETLTQNYHSDYRLILTGTPLQNNLPELWALLNFVLPKIFNSVKSFDEWFNTPFANTGGQDKIELSEEEALLVIRRLHKVLRPFLLRRLKRDVEKDLPNKVEKVVKCKASALQQKLYQMMLHHNILYTADENGAPVSIKNANNQLMQLKKICNHPFVYEEVETLINPTMENSDQIWRVSGKFELLDRVLPKLKASGHRVLIFFQMTQVMDIMEDFLRLRNLKYMRLDGGTKSDDRTGLLNMFNAPDSEYFCFLLSTRAGGLGLNLQTADTVIIFDTDWNPHQDLQAQDRAHRIGQKNEVRILRLITESSIEEAVLDRAHQKLEIDGKVIQAGKFDQKSSAEEQEAFLRALLEKDEERRQEKDGDVVEEDDGVDNDDELNQVIARDDDELILFKRMDEERQAAQKQKPWPSRLFTEQELPDVYKRDPKELIQKNEISADYGRGSRERKVQSYDDGMTEEQWLKKIDGYASGGDDDAFALSSSLPKKRSRSKRKRVDDFIDDDSDLDSTGSKRQKSATPRARPSRAKSANSKKGNIHYRSTPSIDPLDPQQREQLQTQIEVIYDAMVTHVNADERNCSEIFLVKPPKKIYPDYYVLIKYPIALDTIKKRITNLTYTSIREFMEDVHLMFANARIYNEEGSFVYDDAIELEELASDKLREIAVGHIPSNEVEEILDFKEFDNQWSLKPLVLPQQPAMPVPPEMKPPPPPAVPPQQPVPHSASVNHQQQQMQQQQLQQQQQQRQQQQQQQQQPSSAPQHSQQMGMGHHHQMQQQQQQQQQQQPQQQSQQPQQPQQPPQVSQAASQPQQMQSGPPPPQQQQQQPQQQQQQSSNNPESQPQQQHEQQQQQQQHSQMMDDDIMMTNGDRDMGLLDMDIGGPDSVLSLDDDDLKLDSNEYDMGLDFALDLEG